MDQLINTMYKKRFCIPANNENFMPMNTCTCGNYNHIACIFKGKGKGKCH